VEGPLQGELAVAHEFLAGGRDAWRLAVEAAAGGVDFTAEAYALGHATATVHRRLAETLGVSAEAVPGRDIAPGVAQRMRQAWAEAGSAVGPYQDGLESLLNDLEGVPAGALQRIHGDLHLGQVLVVNGDVAIIDFEGEPSKPVAFRRGKGSRMRDVAGMIRSFDYAAAVVRRTSPVSHAHLDEPRVAAFLDRFAEQATRCFLAGYRQEIEVSPAEEGLLELFLTEKAAYEIGYEAANRPTWIDVPLSGLARLADTLLARPEHA